MALYWRSITIIAASMLLTACEPGTGFRPLYSSLSTGQAVQDKLGAVRVSTIPGRTGQILRNELIFETTRGGAGALPPQYQLDVAIQESMGNSLILSTGQAASGNVSISVAFQLTRLSDRKVLLNASSSSNARIDRSDNAFSNIRALQNAQSIAAKGAARDILARMSSALAVN